MGAVEFMMVRPGEVITRAPFSILFPIQPNVLADITGSMQRDGYDPAEPIVIWVEENVLVEGHTRVQAAITADIEAIPVYYRSFPDEAAALEYAIRAQRNRRNITAADILTCVEAISGWMERGRPSTGEIKRRFENGTRVPFTEGQVADMLGVTRKTVSRAKTVLEDADDEVVEKVKTGELKSIKAAYEVTQQKRVEEIAPPKKIDAKTQAHVAGASYGTLIINAAGKSADTLANLPTDRLARTNAHLYLCVDAEGLPGAFGLMEEWGFTCETVLTIAYRVGYVDGLFDGVARFVLFGQRGDYCTHGAMQAGVILADKGETEKPRVFYSLVKGRTVGPYLEVFPDSYHENVSVWGEETPYSAAPAEVVQEDWGSLNDKEKVRRILSDGAWHTSKEVAEKVGINEATAQSRCRDLTPLGYPEQRKRPGKGPGQAYRLPEG